ncbi:speckle-type POZ protein-like isoform X1 [Armigeres subalbatus]|uniref:speckle-type POZ protein-like isoform X1 n=1 Tax=Armigeres subalbatus TaxID=124917 RepID=UPI002ED2D8FC
MSENRRNHWCIYKAKFETLNLTWTIENASFVLSPARQICIMSDQFFSRRTQKWRMVVRNHYTKHHLYGVYLVVQTGQPVEAELSISILSSTGKKQNTHKFAAREFPHNQEIGFENYFNLHELLLNQELTTNDTLTLHCEVKALVDSFNISGKGQGVQAASFCLPLKNLDERFEGLLQSERYTDVVIVVQNRELKAHKFMLASQSIVFEAMFESDMREKQESRIIISDLEYEVIEQMLLYMYTSKVPKLKSLADRLLVAADKYALDDLKVVCEQALCEDLTTNRAIELLALAELYNASQLKIHVTQFLDDNIKEVRETTEWKKMIEKHSFRVRPRQSRVPKTAFMRGIFRLVSLICWLSNVFSGYIIMHRGILNALTFGVFHL